MQKKTARDLSASTIQVILNQVLGAVVFLLTSFNLTKELYGELNWTIALLGFITGTISLRLEQVVVRKAAAGEDLSQTLSLFMMHVVLTGAGLLLFFFGLHLLFPVWFNLHQLLYWVLASQLVQYLAMPFRQIANGTERFRLLAVMATVSNALKAAGLVVLLLVDRFTIENILLLFIAGSLAEWITGYLLIRYRMQIPFSVFTRWKTYRNFIAENLPQLGSALLMAGITRMDWILLGFFSTSFITAEYSFAYRVYELSPLPLLILAPLILSRLSVFFKQGKEEDLLAQKIKWDRLIRLEMTAACVIPLVISLVWSPVLDTLTQGKYGSVNQWTFIILCTAMPFQYLTNLCWSVHFAQNRIKLIFRITLITFLMIFAGDLLAIPRWGAFGAAWVYLLAMIVEYINYLRSSVIRQIPASWKSLLVQLPAAGICGFAAMKSGFPPLLQIPFALSLFFLILWATRQVQKSDLQFVFQAISRKKTNPEQSSHTP